MVNPALIPSFSAVGGATASADGTLLAEANVTLPRLVVYSDRLKPQCSKLIDLLSAGIPDAAPTSSTPTPTPTSASRIISTSDPCRVECQDVVALCRSNTDCLVYQSTLASLLGSTSMEMSAQPQNDYGTARVALNMSSVLSSVVPLPHRVEPGTHSQLRSRALTRRLAAIWSTTMSYHRSRESTWLLH